MKVLVVGAGAVGSVYGYYFQKGGADLSFYIREKYADTCRKGLVLYSLNRASKERLSPIEMNHFGVLTTLKEVAQEKWDYVVLTISSTALRGEWLKPFLESVNQEASLVTLQPGLEDREYLLQYVNADRLIEGVIPIIGYHAPLPGETLPTSGTVFWLPPGACGYFSGPVEKVRVLVERMKKAGFPAKQCQDARGEVWVASTVLMVVIAALETANWSFRVLRQGNRLNEACRAIEEALNAVAIHRKVKKPMLSKLLFQPWLFRSVIFLGRWTPFNLEAMLKLHFTKVQKQMHDGIEDILNLSNSTRVEMLRLREINRQLQG